MLTSTIAAVPPYNPSAASPSPLSSRPSRLRGFSSSLLRRGGLSRSNPNSPPVSPPERSTLERSTAFPLPGNNGSINSCSTSSSPSDSRSEFIHLSASTAGDLPNGSTAAAAQAQAQAQATAAAPAVSSSSSSTSSRAPISSTLAPESSSGMARLRRAFSSQNQPQPTNVATSPPGNLPPAPLSAAAAGTTSIASPQNEPGNRTSPPDANIAGRDGLAPDQMPTIKFIPHQDPRSSKPSLAFAATSRTLPHEDCVIRVGRYSERDGPQNPPPGVPSAAPVGFKSKVVSRKHCEFWCSQGQWYIKDIKSSSGTFLNHIRLSQPNQESRPFPINDGDVVQLGMDFKGGEEAIFRCVKIRIECNRNWQKKLNDFNMNTHKRLRELNKTTGVGKDAPGPANECSICLMSIAPCQSLFVAPCSHVWHFKCIRPMLVDHKTYPQFLCPNCRGVTDLEADIEEIEWNQEVDEQQDTDPENASTGDAASTHDSLSAANAVVETTAAPLELSSTRTDGDGHLADAVSTLELADTPVASTTLHSQTAPVQVPGSSGSGARPTTPGDGIAELTGHDGPLTPRNDAGPFVFDGSGGRPGVLRPIPGLAQSLEANGFPEGLAPAPSVS